jgi:hypothetical protein
MGAAGLTGAVAYPYGPAVPFMVKGQLPPTAYYVSADDTIVLGYQALGACPGFQVSALILTPDGQLKFEQVMPNLSVGVGFAQIPLIPPSECYVLSVTMSSTLNTRGVMFASVQVIRGFGTPNPVSRGLLCSGYPTTSENPTYPGGTQRESTYGLGWLQGLTGSVPAAGADWTYTFGSKQITRLKAIQAQLTTSAAGATRFPSLKIADGFGNFIAEIPPATSIGASIAGRVTWGEGLLSAAYSSGATAVLMMPTPTDLKLSGAAIVQVSTQGIQAADQWTAPVLYVEQWPIG